MYANWMVRVHDSPRWRVSRADTPFGALYVHSRYEVVTIPLTGDPQLDALLGRLAAKSGTVTQDHATDSDTLAREYMRNES